MIHLTLYSRTYCHLCDDMLAAMRVAAAEFVFTVDVIDVDGDAALVAEYDELVPVLLGSRDGGETVQLCHYFLDVEKLRQFCRGE